MGFSAKQVQALKRNLDSRYIRTREVNGQVLSYVEGWYALSEANRIFGFDGWNRETLESRCVLTRESRGLLSPFILPKCVLLCGPTIPPSSAKVKDRAKGAAAPLAKFTT